MRRVLLTVGYDGTRYGGWQRQLNALSIQQVLEEALSASCGHPVTVTGASRTDSGVHAAGQRAHFDTTCAIPADKIPFAVNTRLPRDVRVTQGMDVSSAFHARFLASEKTYTYRMAVGVHASALWHRTHLHVIPPLDISRMERAMTQLLGRHDFCAFQAAGGTAKTTERIITDASLTTEGSFLTFRIRGNAFLYNMVRIIVGTLLEIGRGKRDEDAFQQAFLTKNRLVLGVTAPPHGLELTDVCYPDAAFLQPEQIRWHQDTPSSRRTP